MIIEFKETLRLHEVFSANIFHPFSVSLFDVLNFPDKLKHVFVFYSHLFQTL